MVSPLNQRKLSCLATSEHFNRKLSRRFSINDKVISSNASEQSQSTLLQLPCEVQMLIFESLADAPSQVALALTCKQMAHVSSQINLSRSHVSAKYAGLLPKEVFDIPCLMKQLTPWMPDNLRLCDHCLTNRPCDAEYWRTVAICAGGTFWVQKIGWSFSDATWHKQLHSICPLCHVTCSLSDYVDCDGCRALGRLGDIDWNRVAGSRRCQTEEELRAGNWTT